MAVKENGGHGDVRTVHRYGDVRRDLLLNRSGDAHGQGEQLSVIGRAGGNGHLTIGPGYVELVLGAIKGVCQIPQTEVGGSVGAHKGGGGTGLVQIADLYIVHHAKHLGVGVQVETLAIGGLQAAGIDQLN